MADYSAFAPKPLDLGGLAALLGPTGGETGVIQQNAGRRVSLMPLMARDDAMRDQALHDVYGNNDYDNALKQLMMQNAMSVDMRGQGADVMKTLAPALVRNGESSQLGNFGPTRGMIGDMDAFLGEAMPYDVSQLNNKNANTFYQTEQGKAAGTNAEANMIAAEAQRTRAASGGGPQISIDSYGPGIRPHLTVKGKDVGSVQGALGQASGPLYSDNLKQEYSDNGNDYAKMFIDALNKSGTQVLNIEPNIDGKGTDRITTDHGVYMVNPTAGKAEGQPYPDNQDENDNGEQQ